MVAPVIPVNVPPVRGQVQAATFETRPQTWIESAASTPAVVRYLKVRSAEVAVLRFTSRRMVGSTLSSLFSRSSPPLTCRSSPVGLASSPVSVQFPVQFLVPLLSV